MKDRLPNLQSLYALGCDNYWSCDTCADAIQTASEQEHHRKKHKASADATSNQDQAKPSLLSLSQIRNLTTEAMCKIGSIDCSYCTHDLLSSPPTAPTDTLIRSLVRTAIEVVVGLMEKTVVLSVSSGEVKQRARATGGSETPCIHIEDPFDHDHNIAAVIRKKQYVCLLFHRVAR